MDQKIMYAFRGWIAFVAFMDFGVAVRSFIEKRCFLGEFSYMQTDKLLEQNDPTLPRVLGMYSVLKALALIHCTVFIHYRPVISMAICSLFLTIFMYTMEALYYHSTTLNFYIIFPCVLNGLTLIGLIILPRRLLDAPTVVEDENAELLRQATAFRKRKSKKLA
uniref:EXPERA domain-containing protein n=1 Tax=Clastoptera arizonana TaxID=38151 RepID=A0A1B6DEZ1_9HEMI